MHVERTKSKTPAKKATTFDDASASVSPVNFFDPEVLPCDELAQFSCEEKLNRKKG